MEWLDTMELVGGVEGETLRRCRRGTGICNNEALFDMLAILVGEMDGDLPCDCP
jgi:hypothetical protein